MIADLFGLPAFAAYARRVGAGPRSMLAAAVREREGRYWRDVAVIRLDRKTGQIAVTSHAGESVSVYEPSEADRHAVAIEAKDAAWPEHVTPRAIRNLPDELKSAAPDDLFEFHDRDKDGDLILMLQLRRARADGGKDYLPFTYWSDNQWRRMEPDGPLPLWGLDGLPGHATAFLHEGAKAARAVRRMVEAATPGAKAALAAHPWGEDLKNAAHVGWIGGALSPHRTDWSRLHKAGIEHVIIVADNDPPGHAAVPKIAWALRNYSVRVEALRFDSRWPVGFDLADPFPKAMFR